MQRIMAASCAAAVTALVLSCSPAIPTYTLQYAEKRARLDNGLRLVVIPDDTTPMVEVHVRYEVGSNEDPEGKAGLAHLVEHMMFQHRLFGADKPPTFQLLPQIAVGFNAYTTFDQTHYFLTSRKEDVDKMLRLEAARMNAGCTGIPVAEFEREREVVRNEIRQRTGTPEGLVPQLLLDAVYPPGHAYNQIVGGNDAQLSSITFQDVCDFMKKYYTPDRATVVVAGNVSPEDIGNKVQFAFGGIPRRSPAPRKAVAALPEFSYKKVVHELDTERSQIHVMWRLPAQNSDDWPAARAMMAIMASRVARFADDWEFAASVGAFPYGGALAPVYVLSMELHDYRDVDEALGYVWTATRGIHRYVEEGDFDEDTKARSRAFFIMNHESLAARAHDVAHLVQFNDRFEFDSSGEYMLDELEKLDQLDGGEFRAFIEGTLRRDNAVVVAIKSSRAGLRGDKRSGLAYTARTHDKEHTPVVDPREAKRPLPAPQTRSILGQAERYTLDNGMGVVLLPRDGMPVVTTQLLFDVGSAHEPRDVGGLAGATARFLRPPLGARLSGDLVSGGVELESAFARVGAQFFGYADSDHTAFVARGVAIYLDVLIKGLERTIKAGEQNQTTLESWQRYQRLLLDSERHRQTLAFERTMADAIYGPEHPYAATGTPTEASLGKIGRDATTAFQREHYSAQNATLLVVGKFDPARARSIIADTFGKWSGGRRDDPVPPAARPRTGPEYFGVIRDERPQMTVFIAYPAPAGIDAQQAARQVLTVMLNLRMAKIRTELGSTYGTYARQSSNVGPSAYVMGGSVDATRAGESLRAMRDKIDGLRRGENFDQDFAEARRIVLRQLLAESTETRTLADRLANIVAHDLELDHYDKLVEYVAAVSPAQVKALIDQELRPEHEIVGCTADRDTLVKAFEEAGISSVRYIEPN